MTVRYMNFSVDLDKRDKTGRPKVTKTPDQFHFFDNDLVQISISIIENGVETDLAQSSLWLDHIKPIKVKQKG